MQKKYIFECAFIVNWQEWNFLLLSKIRVKLSHRKKIRKHLNIATIQNAEVALCMPGVVNSRASGPIFTTISEKYSLTYSRTENLIRDYCFKIENQNFPGNILVIIKTIEKRAIISGMHAERYHLFYSLNVKMFSNFKMRL